MKVNIPEVFTENTVGLNGDKAPGVRKVTKLTTQRVNAEKTIRKLAQENNETISNVVTTLLLRSLPALQKYVVSQGEKPEENPLKLMVQAAILRANEVATITNATGIDDNDAMLLIEQAENDAVENNHPDAKAILPYDVQAALKLTLDYIASRNGTMKNFLRGVRATFAPRQAYNGYDFPTKNIMSKSNSWGIWGDTEDDYSDEPWLGSTGSGSGSTGSGSGSTGGGLFDIFNKITDGIKKVSDSVNDTIDNTKGTVSSFLDRIKGSLSDIGGSSVEKGLSKYIPMIIITIVIIGIIILIAVYAKRK